MRATVNPGPRQCQPRGRCAGLWACGLLALFLSACGPGAQQTADSLNAFFAAVQAQDLDELYCRMAGVSEAGEPGASDAEQRAAFDAWALAYYAAYEEGRDAGRVDLDEQGLVLVKLFSLGRGTYVKHGISRSLGSDAALVESRVRFGYAHIDLSPFSPGTTFYVCGLPVGRVHPIRVPAGSLEVSVDVLDSVSIEWTLLRTPETESCSGGWKVAAARAVPGSEVAAEVTWIF